MALINNNYDIKVGDTQIIKVMCGDFQVWPEFTPYQPGEYNIGFISGDTAYYVSKYPRNEEHEYLLGKVITALTTDPVPQEALLVSATTDASGYTHFTANIDGNNVSIWNNTYNLANAEGNYWAGTLRIYTEGFYGESAFTITTDGYIKQMDYSLPEQWKPYYKYGDAYMHLFYHIDTGWMEAQFWPNQLFDDYVADGKDPEANGYYRVKFKLMRNGLNY